jgi:Tol biopolymer transport system component
MVHSLRALVPVVLVAGGIGVWSSPPMVGAATSCTITQITKTGSTSNFANADPVISADGTKIAFESSQNLAGSNFDGNQEIVLYDIVEDEFTRVSSTTGGFYANRSPAINATGSRIAWSTDRSMAGGNADQNREIALWARLGNGGTIQYVTNTVTPVSNVDPSIDDVGDDIVYTGGVSSEFEVFHFDTFSSFTTQITNTTGEPNYPGESIQPHINGRGVSVAFTATGRVGQLNDNGGSDILVASLGDWSISAITNKSSSVESSGPAMSDDGQRVAFISDGPFPGLNRDKEEQAFHTQLPRGAMTQLTQGSSGQFGIGGVSITATGTRVVFDSDGDHVGTNPDGSAEIFVHDVAGPGTTVTQVTNAAVGSGEVDIDASGTRIVFSSRADHTGDNPDGGREIFLATCEPPPKPRRCFGMLVTVDIGKGQRPTSASDVILGTPGDDTVNALNGDDVFCGLGGDDVFEGGVGNDWANGGRGRDTLSGGKGNDRLLGGRGADVLNGMGGRDNCLGGPGKDSATTCENVTGVP